MLKPRINARSAALIGGRPPDERELQCQLRRNPVRHQRTIVPGETIIATLRIDGNQR